MQGIGRRWGSSCLVIRGQLPELGAGKWLGCVWFIGGETDRHGMRLRMCRGEYLPGPGQIGAAVTTGRSFPGTVWC